MMNRMMAECRAAGFSAADIGSRFKIPAGVVTRWERGELRPPAWIESKVRDFLADERRKNYLRNCEQINREKMRRISFRCQGEGGSHSGTMATDDNAGSGNLDKQSSRFMREQFPVRRGQDGANVRQGWKR